MSNRLVPDQDLRPNCLQKLSTDNSKELKRKGKMVTLSQEKCNSFVVLVPLEEVISQLEADTLVTGACLGAKGSKFNCGSYPQMVRVGIKVNMVLRKFTLLTFSLPAAIFVVC